MLEALGGFGHLLGIGGPEPILALLLEVDHHPTLPFRHSLHRDRDVLVFTHQIGEGVEISVGVAIEMLEGRDVRLELAGRLLRGGGVGPG